MPSSKKAAEKRPKKEKEAPPSDEEDDDDDEEEEEEVFESEHVRRKREKGRNAFLKLIRRFITLIPLAIVLSKQPMMMKPRAPGVNSAKMKPLELAISGAVHFAATSPTFVRNPKLHEYLNMTGRVLLTPSEYFQAQQSKRAMPAEQTLSGAYRKTAKAFTRMVDKDTLLKEMVTAPQPNLPLIGSLLVLFATVFCPLAGGIFEYLIVIGLCVCAYAETARTRACTRTRAAISTTALAPAPLLPSALTHACVRRPAAAA